MFIVTLRYKENLTVVDKYLQAHREFLDYHYKQGLLLASGPMKPRIGGIVIALTNDEAYLKEIFKQDPFFLAEIAEYEFVQFIPIKHRQELHDLILKSEGKLC